MEITTVGIDLAKSIFQVHAVDAAGHVVVRKARAGAGPAVLRQAAAMPGRHGGVRHGAPLGPGAHELGPRTCG